VFCVVFGFVSLRFTLEADYVLCPDMEMNTLAQVVTKQYLKLAKVKNQMKY